MFKPIAGNSLDLVKQKRRQILSLRYSKIWRSLAIVALLVLLGFIPVQIAIARHQVPVPQAILVLGGNTQRMTFAADFWQEHSELDIWLSGVGTNSNFHRRLFREAGVPENKIHFDLCATDTVTNFTCPLQDFVRRNLRHLYLITSDYHMARSRAIATLILGSRGIIITPVAVPSSGYPSESLLRIIRDCIRCILWLITGYSGASLNPDLR